MMMIRGGWEQFQFDLRSMRLSSRNDALAEVNLLYQYKVRDAGEGAQEGASAPPTFS